MAFYIIKTYSGYYAESHNGIIEYHGKPVLNDIGCEDIVRGIAKQVSEEMKDKVIITRLEDKYFDSVDYQPRKTFNDLSVGDKFVFNIDIKHGDNSYEYIKLRDSKVLCIKCPNGSASYYLESIILSSTSYVTLIKENCLENV